MTERAHEMTEIVIPTGRGGCCCIIPLALMAAPCGVAGVVVLVRLWRRVRNRAIGACVVPQGGCDATGD